MKAAVSIPDDVFLDADKEARRLGISRSELVTRALRMLLEAERSERVRASYDLAFSPEDDEPGRDDAIRSATRRALLGVEW